MGRGRGGMQQMIPMTPGIMRYSSPDAMATGAMVDRGMQMVGQGGHGVLDTVHNTVNKVGGILGGIENGIGTALKIGKAAIGVGKAVAPYLPLAAALL